MIPCLYYEVLDLPLHELETKLLLLVEWQSQNTQLHQTLKILVSRNARFDSVCKKIEEKAPLELKRGIVLFEVVESKISRVVARSCPASTKLTGTLVAQEVRPEEADKQEGDRLLCVSHAYGGPDALLAPRPFGRPFRCLWRKDEPFQVVRERIRLRLELSVEAMEDWKCVIVHYKDRTVVADTDKQTQFTWGIHTFLALNHPNPHARSSTSRGPQKGIQIHG